MSDEKVYRTIRKSDRIGDLEFQPALPNDKLMAAILNNQTILKTFGHEVVMKKVIDMEWKWFERRIMKCGDTPEFRNIQSHLRKHIKDEKKWIAKGAKQNAV